MIENDFHNPRDRPNFGGIDFFGYLANWLNDALAGKYGPGHKREILVPEHGDGGPYVGTDDRRIQPAQTRRRRARPKRRPARPGGDCWGVTAGA